VLLKVKKKLNFGKKQMKNEQHNEHKNVNDILVENEVLANEKIAVDKNENLIEVSFHSYLLQRIMSMFFF